MVLLGERLYITEELNRYEDWEGGQCVCSMVERGAKMRLESRQAQTERSLDYNGFAIGIH